MSWQAESIRRAIPAAALLGALAAVAPALAGTGDIYRVASERANLRSAPGDQSTVRTTLGKDEQMVELRTDGRWLGVRVLKSGEEGWIYSGMVQVVSQSGLGEAGADPQSGFGKLSADFDKLVAQIDQAVGYSIAGKVEQKGNALRVVPTAEWLLGTGRDAKLYAAAALYAMWKNYNNGREVTVRLGADDNTGITISDSNGGPLVRAPMFVATR
jgi:hypothetical protein